MPTDILHAAEMVAAARWQATEPGVIGPAPRAEQRRRQQAVLERMEAIAAARWAAPPPAQAGEARRAPSPAHAPRTAREAAEPWLMRQMLLHYRLTIGLLSIICASLVVGLIVLAPYLGYR